MWSNESGTLSPVNNQKVIHESEASGWRLYTEDLIQQSCL